MKNPLPNLSTKKLLSILHTELSGMEFVGGAFKDVDELVLAAHNEFDRRFADRGEYVRLSNKTKGLCGPAYMFALKSLTTSPLAPTTSTTPLKLKATAA